MASIIKFLKTREVKSPSRANEFDAGIDFYVPELTDEFIKVLCEKNSNINIPFPESDRYILLYPPERILIPSGIHCQMSQPGRALIAANKSGVATKYGLIFGAQVVDYEYQGEIHLSIINTGKDPVKIMGGQKILQFIETPVFNSDIIVLKDGDVIGDGINVNLQSFYKKETSRGASGFGDSDKK
jgi:dUTPase